MKRVPASLTHAAYSRSLARSPFLLVTVTFAHEARPANVFFFVVVAMSVELFVTTLAVFSTSSYAFTFLAGKLINTHEVCIRGPRLATRVWLCCPYDRRR